MANQPLNIVIKQLVQCLKRCNEPVSVDGLLRFSNITVKDPHAFKKKLRVLLGIAVRLGLVQEYNNHFYATTHAEDILPLLTEDTGSDISIISSEETFEEAAGLLSLDSDLSLEPDLSDSEQDDEADKDKGSE
ncbi:uncharacterized protein LOC135437529 [Drosophila montana]|uniref:uncharacterized protein LOC135437529 n=1 Tax=Drosophila montana TaxID=40370 RepID=UPI00313CCB49